MDTHPVVDVQDSMISHPASSGVSCATKWEMCLDQQCNGRNVMGVPSIQNIQNAETNPIIPSVPNALKSRNMRNVSNDPAAFHHVLRQLCS